MTDTVRVVTQGGFASIQFGPLVTYGIIKMIYTGIPFSAGDIGNGFTEHSVGLVCEASVSVFEHDRPHEYRVFKTAGNLATCWVQYSEFLCFEVVSGMIKYPSESVPVCDGLEPPHPPFPSPPPPSSPPPTRILTPPIAPLSSSFVFVGHLSFSSPTFLPQRSLENCAAQIAYDFVVPVESVECREQTLGVITITVDLPTESEFDRIGVVFTAMTEASNNVFLSTRLFGLNNEFLNSDKNQYIREVPVDSGGGGLSQLSVIAICGAALVGTSLLIVLTRYCSPELLSGVAGIVSAWTNGGGVREIHYDRPATGERVVREERVQRSDTLSTMDELGTQRDPSL